MRKAARATLLAGLAVLHGCGPTIAKPQLHPVENADLLGVKPRALKVHMLTGELVVLESWRLTTDRLALQGTGTRYTVAREPRDSGRLSVMVAEVALLETNDRERVSSLATAGLSALTVFWGTLSVICGIDPKACFGSCPTFYLEDDQEHPRAEGFSSSIARALEARDLDALGEVHPRRGHLSILMKNEALETHAVRRVRLLAIEKPAGARVFATAAGQFRAVTSLAAPTECRWKATKNPDRARWAAHTAVLAPITTAADRAQAVVWAEIALETEPERPERLALQGAALFRAGRARDSLTELGKVVAKVGDDAPPSAFAWLALAHRQLGNAAEKALWRSRAEAALKRLDAAGPQPSKGDLASEQGGLLAWEQRAELRVLLAELRANAAEARPER